MSWHVRRRIAVRVVWSAVLAITLVACSSAPKRGMTTDSQPQETDASGGAPVVSTSASGESPSVASGGTGEGDSSSKIRKRKRHVDAQAHPSTSASSRAHESAAARLRQPLVINTEPAPRHERDRYPDEDIDVSEIPEPFPQVEPLARYGNRSPYTVLGKTYEVLQSADGYVEQGLASWYGLKFHGRLTSTREPYDMYAFTAAHKTLPLPSYARVTNLDNGRSVIVRVNDRGPFHRGRIIDLSYAAASRLGILQRGTGRVEVEAIASASANVVRGASDAGSAIDLVANNPQIQSTNDERDADLGVAKDAATGDKARRGKAAEVLVQAGTFADKDNAKRLRKQIKRMDLGRVFISTLKKPGRNHYRVRLGPFETESAARFALKQIARLGVRAVIIQK